MLNFFLCSFFLQSYSIASLRRLIEQEVGHDIGRYSLQQRKKRLDEYLEEQPLTLRDHGVRNQDTLFLLRGETPMRITNPQVHLLLVYNLKSVLNHDVLNVCAQHRLMSALWLIAQAQWVAIL